MFRNVQIVAACLVGALFALSALSRRYPRVAWLQAFRIENKLTDAQRARIRRRANITSGVELIAIGIAIPLGHAALSLMFFQTSSTAMTLAVYAAAALCITLGVVAIMQNVRDRGSSR
jgi:uncharacterized iron-regulated membrane protein